MVMMMRKSRSVNGGQTQITCHSYIYIDDGDEDDDDDYDGYDGCDDGFYDDDE